ncbi:hypothetical protein M9H77_26604 [Catharanthus roseus]|uniref:Uncharacterized protein n=1 Tax=Catharanthus roseus TaxID=4058 RepID=A0ACC0AE70_CATRO|nr:hypothetical protein M9H77_26604 [Catharanthus roseus]
MNGLLSIIFTLMSVEFKTTRSKCSESITGKSSYGLHKIQNHLVYKTCQHHRGPLLLAEHHHRPLLTVLFCLLFFFFLLNSRPSKNLSSWLSVDWLTMKQEHFVSFAILSPFYHHPNNLSLGSLIFFQACTSSYQDRIAAQCKFRVS